MASTRRLAAILAADVAGYSRLMGADEEATHQRVQAHLRELVDPKISERHGRVVKNTGDGVLAEFASVVDAVRCGVEVQRAMVDRDPELPEDRRIKFRIGINLGDVIVEADDIFGDGVNIAARLEALAEPGGICVSRTVRDNVRDKLDFAFEDMGEQQVKNIARPVRVYALHPEAVADLPASSVPSTTPVLPVAPRLSIVVLPFANLSDDREQQYFADGITEDLTTDLSRIENMFVISRNTAFTYQGKRVDTKQIGRELGVRYVLEGSIRRSGNQVRVNAQLIDAETDAHLWAERFDGNTSDLFALQDEVTSRIAIALDLALNEAEAVRPTKHPDVQDYIFRGRAVASKPPTRDDYAEAIRLFELALALDTRSAEAQASLADVLVGRVLDQMTATPATDIARAQDLVGRALSASPRIPVAHYAKANILRQMRRCEEAISEYQTVIEFDRNEPGAYANLGWCKLLTGAIEEAIPALEQALRLSPRDSRAGNWHARIGLVHLLQSRIPEALLWAERAGSTSPALPYVHALLASAYGQEGVSGRAAVELAEAQRLSAADRYSSIARLRVAGLDGSGFWGRPRHARCSKPHISLGCARPGCRRNDRHSPSCRDLGS
jgi:TolB-like protein/class 3 adenylate cyclase/Flp pilus assembly protein TadD